MALDPQDRYRSAHIDTLEERLVLSAQPAMELYLDSFLTAQIEAATEEIAPAIADVHEFTGVGAVHADYQFTGAGQTIAVIDTGIAYDHYALGGGFGTGYRVVGGWDFAENDADPYDDGPAGFHGTHVAGIVGSSDEDHRGVAPDADLVALRVFDDQGRATFDWVESALQWVHEHQHDFENPITTVNLSLGVDWNQDFVPNWAMLEDEFAQLRSDGIFIAVAAGNSFADYGSSGLSYPAASPHVVPVASVGDDGNLSDFSQRNDRVIAAPGEAISSTIPNHLYGDSSPSYRFMSLSGTSMATPYLAGSSMLLRQAMESAGYTQIDQDTLYQTFRDTADQIWDTATQSTYSRLNLQAAIDSIFAQADEPTTPSATDLGLVDDYQIAEVELHGTQYYQLRAMRNGILAVTADVGAGALELTAFDEQMNLLSESRATAVGARLGLNVDKGDVILVRASGEAEHVDLHFSNVIERQGNRIIVNGTTGDDAMRFVFTDKLRVQVNGMNYGFDLSRFDQLRINGAQGSDQLEVIGSDQKDVAQLQGQKLRWVTNDLVLVSENVERYTLDGGGGRNLLRLRDTAGDDHVIAGPDGTIAQGSGYSIAASNFQDVRAFGGEGRDTGQFSGSAHDDRFVGRSSRSSMITSDWKGHLFNFDFIQAQGGEGRDIALIFGTRANDAFTLTPESGYVDGNGYTVNAATFHRTVMVGGGGSDQVAHSIAIDANDFQMSASRATVRGDGYWYVVRDIDVTHAMGLQELGQFNWQTVPDASHGSSATPSAFDAHQTTNAIAIPTIASHHVTVATALPYEWNSVAERDWVRQQHHAAAYTEFLVDDSHQVAMTFGRADGYGNEVSPYFWDVLGRVHSTEAVAPLTEENGNDSQWPAESTETALGNETEWLVQDDYSDIVATVQEEMNCLEFLFEQLNHEEKSMSHETKLAMECSDEAVNQPSTGPTGGGFHEDIKANEGD